MKKKLFICSILLASLFATGCKDDFADINTDPSQIQPDVRYLFTEALIKMDQGDYVMWFYNNSKFYLPWTQTTASTSGNTDALNTTGGTVFRQESQLIKVKSQVEALKAKVATLSGKEEASYTYIEAICNPMMIYVGLMGTDSYGSMAYTEAGKALFTDPPIITPKYENQQELYNIWLDELDYTISTLTNPVMFENEEVPQVSLGTQDFVYGGNVTKWLKFANSLKLKIAVRLLHADKAKALKIAEDVAKSSAGVMDGLADDFIWNPGSQFYHFGDNISFGGGGLNLVNFLVDNRDPRVRFLFDKNQFNSRITAEFINQGKKLPYYIDQYVNYSTNAEGKKIFNGWKSPGEPWVRYHGVPVDFQAKFDPAIIDAYYNANNFKITVGDKERQYEPISIYNEEMIRGEVSYEYPALPNESPVKDDTKQPFYAAYLSTAEVNLYLAEFKLLGANLPGSADSYFKKGVEMSVRLLDRLAGLNRIPYYAETSQGYTEYEGSIALKDEELTALLSQPAYQLTGTAAEQLEKVYIQEYIHFLYMPNDMFVTVLRSGVPKTGSAFLARVQFDKNDPNYVIPRRIMIPALNPTDQMYQIKQAAYQEQGFTDGSENPQVLATERLWYDKGAPSFGQGPNY